MMKTIPLKKKRVYFGANFDVRNKQSENHVEHYEMELYGHSIPFFGNGSFWQRTRIPDFFSRKQAIPGTPWYCTTINNIRLLKHSLKK